MQGFFPRLFHTSERYTVKSGTVQEDRVFIMCEYVFMLLLDLEVQNSQILFQSQNYGHLHCFSYIASDFPMSAFCVMCASPCIVSGKEQIP